MDKKKTFYFPVIFKSMNPLALHTHLLVSNGHNPSVACAHMQTDRKCYHLIK